MIKFKSQVIKNKNMGRRTFNGGLEKITESPAETMGENYKLISEMSGIGKAFDYIVVKPIYFVVQKVGKLVVRYYEEVWKYVD